METYTNSNMIKEVSSLKAVKLGITQFYYQLFVNKFLSVDQGDSDADLLLELWSILSVNEIHVGTNKKLELLFHNTKNTKVSIHDFCIILIMHKLLYSAARRASQIDHRSLSCRSTREEIHRKIVDSIGCELRA